MIFLYGLKIMDMKLIGLHKQLIPESGKKS